MSIFNCCVKIGLMDNNSIQDFKKIYSDYFDENVRHEILCCEKKRKNKLIKMILFSLLFFMLAAATSYLFIYLLFHSFYNQIVYAILLLLIYGFLFRSIIYHLEVSREYEKELNENLLKYFLKPVANFKVWPHNHNIENIIDSKIFPNFVMQDDVKSYYGFYNRTGITITETSLNVVTPTDRRALFKGAVIQLELEKNINNHIIIQPISERKPAGFKNVNFENKYVNIFAGKDDADISFIDSELIQIFESIAHAFFAPTMRISVKDNIVLIALPTKRSIFQTAGMYKSLKDIHAYDRILNKFISIFSLVDKLN